MFPSCFDTSRMVSLIALIVTNQILFIVIKYIQIKLGITILFLFDTSFKISSKS